MPSRKDGPPSILDTHGMSGNVFANPDASSSAPYPRELNQWNSSSRGAAPFIHSGKEWEANTESRSEMPVWTVSQKSQSSSVGGDSSKELWSRPTTTADFRSSFWQIPYTSNLCLLEDKVQDRGMYLSQFPTEAVHWIKEVELVDSVDDLKSSSSTRGISMPNFEVLDAKIASALNRIIHNSHFKRRISLEEQKAQKQDRFLSW